MVRSALLAIRPTLETELVIITTSGDWRPEQGETRLSSEAGGKGQFAKEIEQALMSGDIDIAVHSMKDMESFLPDALTIPWMLPREDARDAMILSPALQEAGIQSLDALPHGAVIGTASVRRGAFLLSRRPDLKIVPFRGNVQTRLDKLKAGQVDATLLAVAGLNRLGLEKEISFVLSEEEMLPASAQGAVGIECRKDRLTELFFISQISDEKTVICSMSEREVLRALDGSCNTPIGAYATLDEHGALHLQAALCSLDGTYTLKLEEKAHVTTLEQAIALGAKLGADIKSRAPSEILIKA